MANRRPEAAQFRGQELTSTILFALLLLFALRVVGQILVFAGVAPFLPPMDDWQSGLLPYPLLLMSQMAILAIMTTICLQVRRGTGYFARRRASLAAPLLIAGCVYASGMVVRYALLRRDAIPVIFHIVLASFLIVLARFHRRQG